MRGPLTAAPAADAGPRRLAAQLLSGPRAASAAEVVQRLLAVQGQDPRGARLAIRARSSGLTAADVDRALTGDRSLLITWLNRGTLHLVAAADYWWLHRLTIRSGFETACRRNLAGLGISAPAADAGAGVVAAALAADGPLTSAQLAEKLAGAGVPRAGGAALWVLRLASARGIAVRGPVTGGQHAYAGVADWLGPPPPAPDPDTALGWLARRYLAGHGPASDADLARWAAIPLSWARAGLAQISASLAERPDGLAQLAGQPDEPPEPRPVLLGPFDPLLLGWASRELVLGGHTGLVTRNGIFRPVLLVDGRAAGTWSRPGQTVRMEAFGDLTRAALSGLAADAADVGRFLTAGSDEKETKSP